MCVIPACAVPPERIKLFFYTLSGNISVDDGHPHPRFHAVGQQWKTLIYFTKECLISACMSGTVCTIPKIYGCKHVYLVSDYVSFLTWKSCHKKKKLNQRIQKLIQSVRENTQLILINSWFQQENLFLIKNNWKNLFQSWKQRKIKGQIDRNATISTILSPPLK